MLKKWLHEPLLHFLLIGALLFVVYGLKNDGISDQSKRIVISSADINRLALLWGKKWQRLPTRTELDDFIEQQVREQVLYREALAMGLDKNDGIVRRRLVQKLEFISSDIAEQAEPTEADLQDYLSSHSDEFSIPGNISFTQIYLNFDRRGADTEKNAALLLDELNKDNGIDITKLGDPFMFGQDHRSLTKFDVTRLFGKTFAEKLFGLPVKGWQGPIRSGYGLHLIRVDNRTTTTQADLATVRDQVRREWITQHRLDVDKALYQSLREGYEIIIDDSGIDTLTPAQANKTPVNGN